MAIAVPSAWIAAIVSNNDSAASGDSPAEGSSSSNRRGCTISAIAIASTWRCPPDRVRAAARRLSASMGKRCSSAAIRARMPRGSTKPPISRFSHTVMVGNTFASCGTNATPRRARSRGGRVSIGAPSSAIPPDFNRSSPATAFSSVDLPAPFGPMIATSSPAPTCRSTPFRISSAAP